MCSRPHEHHRITKDEFSESGDKETNHDLEEVKKANHRAIRARNRTTAVWYIRAAFMRRSSMIGPIEENFIGNSVASDKYNAVDAVHAASLSADEMGERIVHQMREAQCHCAVD